MCVCVCMSVCVYVCMCVHMHVCVCACARLCVCGPDLSAVWGVSRGLCLPSGTCVSGIESSALTLPDSSWLQLSCPRSGRWAHLSGGSEGRGAGGPAGAPEGGAGALVALTVAGKCVFIRAARVLATRIPVGVTFLHVIRLATVV